MAGKKRRELNRKDAKDSKDAKRGAGVRGLRLEAGESSSGSGRKKTPRAPRNLSHELTRISTKPGLPKDLVFRGVREEEIEAGDLRLGGRITAKAQR